ncbi:MFS transporter [Klebsiella pneumoniae subsp. pneumoniae]|nr:MFS transporter [Klebsiella pneumoniae subsp. pneumoniae]
MLIVGLMAVVVQVLVAWVAILATPQKRGQAVGTLTSGIVSGILLSRFISGAIADIAGWRAVYLTAACLMLVIAGIVLENHAFAPAAAAAAKADLPFLIEVRVSAVPHRAATEKARDPWRYLSSPLSACYGRPWSCRSPPFPSRTPRRGCLA